VLRNREEEAASSEREAREVSRRSSFDLRERKASHTGRKWEPKHAGNFQCLF
jgi:hypothetical protein